MRTKTMLTNLSRLSLLLIALFTIAGCEDVSDPALFEPSTDLPDYQQASFSLYQSETKAWLSQHRYFFTNDKLSEIERIAPQEVLPLKPNGKAVLLVHGLGDSPYSFVDVAEHLAEQGYLVRTVLLPGHGSKPADLTLPELNDWQAIVSHHVTLLKQKQMNIWLGGYSTGANLVTQYAITDNDIQGLLLFAPAYQPVSFFTQFASLAKHFTSWATRNLEDNYLRYNSLAMNGVANYHQTTQLVEQLLSTSTYNHPVFMILSEYDSVIDSNYSAEQFSSKMMNPSSHLIWLGEEAQSDTRSTSYSMRRNDLKISSGSHMAMLFSPENIEYGEKGKNKICQNGQGSEKQQRCEAGEEVWFSGRGYVEENKIFARTTYNPYFDQSMRAMDNVMKDSELKRAE
ncbi:alpha/beta fold hydrolase [Vibrio sp. ZSDE26]|uniref:Alpha/beta fold hydrolase n=1 Tax=Vibrio amylolyticus TaxID=2847292 RepID=A0A9X1XNP5_9VIBR|nr:alpha/beta fold hydrolase [Vibrio amylolyticus]MCK6265323.1 alpha/beta fold hydrolase [Vibrio amylolyticus]